MTAYTLDTDTTTLLLRGHAEVCAHAAAVDAEQLSVTIITVEEILSDSGTLQIPLGGIGRTRTWLVSKNRYKRRDESDVA